MAKQEKTKASDAKDAKEGKEDKKGKEAPEEKSAKSAAPGEDANDETAEGEDEGEGEGLPATPKSKLKKILMIGLPVVVLLAGGGASVLSFGLLDGEDTHDAAPAAPVAIKPVYFDMPDILVNINGRQRRPAFLKVAMSLELKSSGDAEKIQQAMPRVVDSFQVYLRELRSDDLTSSAGMMRLREDLLLRINEAVAPAKVRDILFREMLIQ